jgi:hypothetical protein
VTKININHPKGCIDKLNIILIDLKLYELMNTLIGQSTLESLSEYLILLKILVIQDKNNSLAAQKAQIYDSI